MTLDLVRTALVNSQAASSDSISCRRWSDTNSGPACGSKSAGDAHPRPVAAFQSCLPSGANSWLADGWRAQASPPTRDFQKGTQEAPWVGWHAQFLTLPGGSDSPIQRCGGTE